MCFRVRVIIVSLLQYKYISDIRVCQYIYSVFRVFWIGEFMDTSIGERIKKRRIELNITGKQVYEIAGISTGNLSGIESGKSLPSAMALLGLSKILSCSVDWILTGKTPISEIGEEVVNLTNDEKELLLTYKQLDRRGQHRVHTTIYDELDRMNGITSPSTQNVG